MALALAKMAGDLGQASRLYERSVTPVSSAAGVGPAPLARWSSFWQTCELFVPQLAVGSALFTPFLDPQEPALHDLSTVLQESTASIRLDLGHLLASAGRGGSDGPFRPHAPALIEEGSWERLVLYDGKDGWHPRWCGPQAARPLHLCGLLQQRLPGASRGLTRHYLLHDHEEVSISRLLPRTRVRLHSGGTNARINLDLSIRGARGASVRVGGQLRQRGDGPGSVLAYNDCYDRQMAHEGPDPFYWLQVGVMHQGAVEGILLETGRREL